MKKEFDIDKCWYKQNKKCLYNKNEVTILSNKIDDSGQVAIRNQNNNFCIVPAIYLQNITNYKEYWVYFLRQSTLDNLTLDIKISPCVFLSKEEALSYAEKQINLQNSSLPLLNSLELIGEPIIIYKEEIIDDNKIPFVTEQDKEMVKNHYKDKLTESGKEIWINIWTDKGLFYCSHKAYDSYEKAEKGRSEVYQYICEPMKVTV